MPIIYLHGGPGGSIDPKNRRYFNPKKYRIILFDQRGSGKSKPEGSIVNNTTNDLVNDMEKISKNLSPKFCKRANLQTVNLLRSKPVDIS